MPPKICSISSDFVLWETANRWAKQKYCCSPKVKYFGPPQINPLPIFWAGCGTDPVDNIFLGITSFLKKSSQLNVTLTHLMILVHTNIWCCKFSEWMEDHTVINFLLHCFISKGIGACCFKRFFPKAACFW